MSLLWFVPAELLRPWYLFDYCDRALNCTNPVTCAVHTVAKELRVRHSPLARNAIYTDVCIQGATSANTYAVRSCRASGESAEPNGGISLRPCVTTVLMASAVS